VRIMGADVVYSPANYGPLMVGRSVVLIRNSLAVAMKEVRLSKIAYWVAVASMTLLSLLVARRVVAVSRYTVDSLIHWPFGAIRKKISIVNHGVSESFGPGPSSGRRGNVLLAVGDIYIQKNYHTLIEVFRRLLVRHPDLVLSIAGRPVDRDYADSLKTTIATLGLEGKVNFLGHVAPEDLARLYRECRVFAFPSTVETFGNPLVEALACGAPVACSNRTAMPEIAGDAVEFFDPEDAGSMLAAIERLLTDEARCAELSRLAVARASHFSWERSAAEVAAILKQAAS
ncbi:MAG: glycosyltransferase family 1 protein, partial [Magnetospirillum sp.]